MNSIAKKKKCGKLVCELLGNNYVLYQLQSVMFGCQVFIHANMSHCYHTKIYHTKISFGYLLTSVIKPYSREEDVTFCLLPTSQVLWYFKQINFVSIVVISLTSLTQFAWACFIAMDPILDCHHTQNTVLTNLKRLWHLFSHDTLVLRFFPWLEPCHRVSLARLLENMMLCLRPLQYGFMM